MGGDLLIPAIRGITLWRTDVTAIKNVVGVIDQRMLTIKHIDRAFKDCSLPVVLRRGKGYFYLVYDDGDYLETHSVYVYRLNQLTLDNWIDEARELMTVVAYNLNLHKGRMK